MAHLPRRTSRYFEGLSLAEARKTLRQRPDFYDPDIADVIIQMIANGETLSDICEDRDAPLPATFLRWCKEDERLMERYHEALESHVDVIFDESAAQAFDSDSVRAGVRHRALLTRAERMMPEKYGPRATLRQTKEVPDEGSGIDYAGEVRRRIETISERLKAAAANGQPEDGGPPQS